jgi:sarcosine oxidase
VGAWLGALVPALQPVVAVERQVLHWFTPRAEDAPAFAPGRCPIHLWQFDGGRFFYGFPELGAGVKMGFHHGGEATTADRVRRQVAAAEQEEVRAAVRRFVPTAGSRLRASAVCLYTNTPDGHFRIGRLPEQSNVVVASPCSGHGFKFAPVIGEIVADLVEEKRPMFDIALFGLG